MKDKKVLVYQLLCIALLVALVCVVFRKTGSTSVKADSTVHPTELLENKAEK